MTVVDISERRMKGEFIGETNEHWLFKDHINEIWRTEETDAMPPYKIKKANFRGTPPMNHSGDLILDKSYYIEENGDEMLGGLSGRLITFEPINF